MPNERRSVRQTMSHLLNGVLNKLGYALVRFDDARESRAAADGQAYAYANLQLLDVYAPWRSDAEFLAAWTPASTHTLADVYRAYELYQCVREVQQIPGDILEVGVWRGGTGSLLAAAARRWKPASKVWLCDTFMGVVKAGREDSVYVGGEHADTSAATVQALLDSLQLQNAQILAGIFPEDTGAQVTCSEIALCHIDVDVYQSAADIVEWLLPRLAPGAMLVFDDYGFSTCPGITRLVNTLRDSGEWRYFYNLNKHAVLTRR